MQASVLQHNAAVLLAQALQLDASLLAPCVDYEAWFEDASSSSEVGATEEVEARRNGSGSSGGVAAARLGAALGLSLALLSASPDSGYDGGSGGSGGSGGGGGRGGRGGGVRGRAQGKAKAERLAERQRWRQGGQQQRRLSQGGVVQSGWKRAEGVPFDPKEAAPLLESFHRLHRLLVAAVCSPDADDADADAKGSGSASGLPPSRRLERRRAPNRVHRADAQADNGSRSVDARPGGEGRNAAGAAVRRRLGSDNCHWQAWNKKRVCDGKTASSSSSSSSSSHGGGSDTLEQHAQWTQAGAKAGAKADAFQEGTSAHPRHARPPSGGGRRGGNLARMSPGQGSDPALLKPLGFDVVRGFFSLRVLGHGALT
jgi:hypothetical protein